MARRSADGADTSVDRTLIREWLGKSPAERLALADAAAQEIEALRDCVVHDPVRP